MSIKMVLFDLDGTLLPMDMDEFTSGYFRLLAKKAAPYGYEAQSLVKAVWRLPRRSGHESAVSFHSY